MNVAQKSQSIIMFYFQSQSIRMFYLKSQSKWILGKKANQLDVSIKEPININVYKKPNNYNVRCKERSNMKVDLKCQSTRLFI